MEEDDDGAPNPFRPPIAEGLFFLLAPLVAFDLAMPSAAAAAAVVVLAVVVLVDDVVVHDATGETASPLLGGARRQLRTGDSGDDDGGRKAAASRSIATATTAMTMGGGSQQHRDGDNGCDGDDDAMVTRLFNWPSTPQFGQPSKVAAAGTYDRAPRSVEKKKNYHKARSKSLSGLSPLARKFHRTYDEYFYFYFIPT